MKQITEKKCSQCKQIKFLSEFYGGIKDAWCKDCRKANWKKNGKYYHRRSRIKNADRDKDKNLRQKYGITMGDYKRILVEQNSLCSLCGSPFETNEGNVNKGKMPVVDHDHDTGKVRGILHGNCNRAIGLLGDTSAVLYAAYQYLLKAGR